MLGFVSFNSLFDGILPPSTSPVGCGQITTERHEVIEDRLTTVPNTEGAIRKE
jgi:hypothetical protein